MELYTLILDILTAVIGISIIISAYRKGFLRSIILVVGYVAAIVLAINLSRFFADWTYTVVIEHTVAESINTTLAHSVEELSVATAIPALLAKLPAFITNPLLAGYGGEAGLIQSLEESTSGAVENLGDVISKTVVEPIVVALLQMLFCLLIFALCVIIVKAVAALFKGFYNLPIIGPINSLLGAVVGILEAVIALYVLALIVSLVISFTGNELPWLNGDVIRSTHLFRWFYSFPLIS